MEREKVLELVTSRKNNLHSPASFVLPLLSMVAEAQVVPSWLVQLLASAKVLARVQSRSR